MYREKKGFGLKAICALHFAPLLSDVVSLPLPSYTSAI
jgi:hypothetical protein